MIEKIINLTIKCDKLKWNILNDIMESVYTAQVKDLHLRYSSGLLEITYCGRYIGELIPKPEEDKCLADAIEKNMRQQMKQVDDYLKALI